MAKERIIALSEEIAKHNHNYYVLNSPIISDFEYDLLINELQTLEKNFPEYAYSNSPTQKVGSDIEATQGARKFAQRTHQYPMLSLSNTYNKEELYEFDNRISKSIETAYSYSCELKFDGTAISLTYKNGILQNAVTRGDGVKGDDVTKNILTINAIPQQLHGNFPEEFEIRGEIYMPFDDFYRLNAEREESDETPFANPRNAAAGSLKLIDSDIVAERGLSCVLYHLLGENLNFKTHSEALQAAASWGLPTSKYAKVAYKMEDVQGYIDYWDIERKNLPFATDGIVIKVNELESQRKLGFTAKSPRWATAFKFKPETALTNLLSIDYQVGRTGAVTPVANLEPVQLSGTVVKRATLHNKDQMDLLDIRIGDYVYVEKGGEIIPKITAVEQSKRTPDVQKPIFPSVCPDCGTPLMKDEEQARHYCPNSLGCPTQQKAGFLHFISRKAMDIHAGEATIEQLYDKGYIRRFPDLYLLDMQQLTALDGFQNKSAANLLQSIRESVSRPFPRLLYALGIKHVGETIARMLARQFKSMDALASATREDLLQIDDVGEILADSIIAWFADCSNQEMLEKLRKMGLQFAMEEDTGNLSNALEGVTIVVSGVFSISREELKEYIEKHGGKSTGSVSGNTTYLVAGEKPGAEKVKKAEKLGIAVISEEELYAIVNEQEK
ncbi:MAG: NAD-dependent DNA ligase LigA [Bacteroidales bacterium]|nr:NAD-dependent DNA ligase LigA [Bacteroidales bacterium]